MNNKKILIEHNKKTQPLAFVFILYMIGICSAFQPAAAQQPRIITLEEAINLAIKNSHTLQADTAKMLEAAAIVRSAEEERLPSLSLSGSYLRLNSANVDVKLKSNNTSGGTAESSSPNISQAAYGTVTASYPIFTGGRLKYGIESAKYLEQATLLDVGNDKGKIKLNVINAFTNLYKAIVTIDLVKESLASSRHRDSTFVRLEANGLLARNDLLKAQLQTSDIELSLLDAENNRKLANVSMNLMLGLQEDLDLAPDSNAVSASRQMQNLEDYETVALHKRKDVQALAFRKKAALTNIKSAKTEGYPNIALTGGYIAAYVPHVITITNAVNAGVGIRYNLASLWKTNTPLLRAKAQQQQISANEAELNDAVKLQVNKDYQNYLLNQKKIDVYQVAVNQATENLRITQNKYNNSLVTTTELLDAEVALLRTRINLSTAKADAVSAYNTLLQTTGQLSD